MNDRELLELFICTQACSITNSLWAMREQDPRSVPGDNLMDAVQFRNQVLRSWAIKQGRAVELIEIDDLCTEVSDLITEHIERLDQLVSEKGLL